jgi:hypothetical protein
MYGLELMISQFLRFQMVTHQRLLTLLFYFYFLSRLVILGTFAQTLCGQSGAVDIIGTVRFVFVVVWIQPRALKITL